MKKTKIFLLLIAMLSAIAFTACGGGGGGDGGGGNTGGSGGGTSLTSITVTPANTSFYRGATKQFTATGNYSDGSTKDLTSSVSWGSSDASVATISSAGLAAANSNKSGPTTIIAASGSILGSAQLMVSINLPKTGQTTIYAAGDDGDLQRGVAWPSPRFTDNSQEGIVIDNLTGLMWFVDANCIKNYYPEFDNDGTPGDGMVTWQHALDFVAGINAGIYPNCNGQGQAANNDWRLPNRKELRSLINYGEANTATWLNGQVFGNVQADGYWSSSTYAGVPAGAWFVGMWSGLVGGYTKASTNYVWPVRAGQ